MMTRLRTRIGEWLTGVCFRWVHGHFLVYNTCWEDPRLDREALQLGPKDRVLMLTSAGCNALDYALAGASAIDCVDVNPRQNALLELKIAAIRKLDYEAFFALFGCGESRHAGALYRHKLRAELSLPARRYWDRGIGMFHSARGSFYFHGTAGGLAWMTNHYIDRVARLRPTIDRLLDATTVEEQQTIYTRDLHQAFWTGFLRWAMNRDLTLTMLGVPRAQRRQVETTYPGGIAKFVEDRLAAVFRELPLADNYFWRVYLTGHYTKNCCPEYLRPDNFARLQQGLLDRIRIHTGTLLSVLRRPGETIDRFVLLDHMDWLSTHHRAILQEQWQALLTRAAPQARFLWRSGGLSVDYLEDLEVTINGRRQRLQERLRYHRDWAAALHRLDRVHTYGCFCIADLN
jgi:S-adenosylmethionine-diacylglycerol 3-amino-3-carboxypropyl transferase